MKKILLSLVLLLTVSLTATASVETTDIKSNTSFEAQIGENLLPILDNIFIVDKVVVVGACKTTVKKRLGFDNESYWYSSECWQDSNGNWFKTQAWTAHWEDDKYVPAGSNVQASNSNCTCG